MDERHANSSKRGAIGFCGLLSREKGHRIDESEVVAEKGVARRGCLANVKAVAEREVGGENA